MKLQAISAPSIFRGFFLHFPILDGDSEIVLTTRLESKPYIDLTIKVMRDFGVEVQETESGYLVRGNQQYKTRDYIVESDWSQAAFFLVGGAVGKSGCAKRFGYEFRSGR